MKTATTCIIAMSLLGCSDRQIEEFAFRKSLEHSLIEVCGENDKGCIDAVKTQTETCMAKSNWHKYLENNYNDAEKERFTGEFYACVVDTNGRPYFVKK